jgi:dihydroorotate dehydrogenase (NAD+) catalytic subunit
VVDLSVRIGDVALENPVMPGSGTASERLADLIDMRKLGAIVAKTITPLPREGNPPPRAVEYKDGVLWNIGIPNKGPDYFLAHTLPFYRQFGRPVIASIQADTVADFGRIARRIAVAGVAAIEANVSCPNLQMDGIAFAMDPGATTAAIRAIRSETALPIWAKLTANVGDIAAIARAAEGAGADAIIVANALLGMAIDVETFKPKLGGITGALTGAATRPIIVRMVFQCARAVKIPIIATGGVESGADAVEYLLAGASAVQVGTASFRKSATMIAVIDELRAFCEARGIARLADLIGGVRIEPALTGSFEREQRM